MWVLFLRFFTCASRRCLSPGLFRLYRQPPYMRFPAIPHFRRYISACLTCAFPPSPFPQVHIRLPYMRFSAIPISAGTIPLALHAFSRHSSFPQVQNTRPLNSGRVLYPSISVLIFSDSIRSPQPYRQTAFSGISVCVRRRHGSHRCG